MKILYKLRLVLAYKDAIRTRVPLLFKRMIARSQKQTRKAAAALRSKETIEVAFLLSIPGMWKLDYLFRLMRDSKRYHPYVVIFPYSQFKGFDTQTVNDTVRRTEQFIKERGFEYVVPYDPQTRKWLDIRKTLNPDIVFFTTPYRDIPPQYYYYNFSDKLTCYVPYAFQAMNAYNLNYNQIAINLYSLNFAETPMHIDFAKRYSKSHGTNFFLTGYPGIEVFLRNDYHSPDPWKPQTHAKKRIIWAPHHTIDGGDDFQSSTFLHNCDLMLQLAEQYSDRVQFAFKPHQLLKFKLIQLWGEERTNNYYARWQQMENTQLEESSYVDLFIHSDAMMHDSGSFTVEYLYLNKPVMYLVHDNHPEQQFNLFGQKAFACHRKGQTLDQMRSFIDDVINGTDPMYNQRKEFVDTCLLPPNNYLPSENILNAIEKTIENSL